MANAGKNHGHFAAKRAVPFLRRATRGCQQEATALDVTAQIVALGIGELKGAFARHDNQGKGEELVPFAKAYSGLTDEEIREVDAFIRKNTMERFGPVRVVKPELVFELGFEGIQRSTRHKSGIAVRFPRMLRMRKDKAAAEANTVDDALELLETHLAAPGSPPSSQPGSDPASPKN